MTSHKAGAAKTSTAQTTSLSSSSPDHSTENNNNNNSNDKQPQVEAPTTQRKNSGAIPALLILLLGSATAAAFLSVGIGSAISEQEDQFERAASETTAQIESAFEDYVNAVGMVHTRCRRRNFSRQDFRDMYDYLSAELAFLAVQFYPNTSHAERPAREEVSRQ